MAEFEAEKIAEATEPGAENGADGGVGVYLHKFKTPFEYEGKVYETMVFDFERLTGRDVIKIENEMQSDNEYALDPLLSRNFQCRMAGRAGKIGRDVLEAMPILDFNKIVIKTRSFLMGSGY